MKHRHITRLVVLFVLLAVGYRIFSNLHDEVVLQTVQKQINRAESENTVVDPWPFIQLLQAENLSPGRLDRQHYALLLKLALKQAALYADIVEAALSKRNYRKAYGTLQRLTDLLLVFGNPEHLFPPYRCLKAAYRNHPYLYPPPEDDPAEPGVLPPPRRLCTYDPQKL